MAIHVFKNIDELSTGLADWIEKLVEKNLATTQRFTFALPGGNTPRKLFEVLSNSPFATSIDWKKIHFFWGDERLVPFDSRENNASMAFENLLNKLDIPIENIHRIRTDITPDRSVAEYQAILESYFEKNSKSFDLILLGLGSDGHTLSLFESNQNFKKDNYVIHVTGKNPPRISLTPTIVNRAAHIAFMVSGKEKANVVSEVSGNKGAIQYPAQLIHPLTGEVEWFLDADAATEIKKK